MKIKFLRPVQGMAYFEGDVAEINDARAAALVNGGAAVIIPDTEGTCNNLPVDIPAREILFNNGLENIDDVRKAVNVLIDFDGINRTTAKKIKAYINGL